jgi:ABC-type dipeptide/oligopeptide/nickel transport system permease component
MSAKILSLVLAAGALVASWRTHVPDDVVSASSLLVSIAPVFVLFGLLSVWLADYLAGFSGPMFRGGYVESPTPAVVFVAFGLLLLVVPLIALLFHIVRDGT